MLFSLKNTVFTVFSGIKQIPVVAGWYYQMHCFFNGETQVIQSHLATVASIFSLMIAGQE